MIPSSPLLITFVMEFGEAMAVSQWPKLPFGALRPLLHAAQHEKGAAVADRPLKFCVLTLD
jgi:hypothetical protein